MFVAQHPAETKSEVFPSAESLGGKLSLLSPPSAAHSPVSALINEAEKEAAPSCLDRPQPIDCRKNMHQAPDASPTVMSEGEAFYNQGSQVSRCLHVAQFGSGGGSAGPLNAAPPPSVRARLRQRRRPPSITPRSRVTTAPP